MRKGDGIPFAGFTVMGSRWFVFVACPTKSWTARELFDFVAFK